MVVQVPLTTFVPPHYSSKALCIKDIQLLTKFQREIQLLIIVTAHKTKLLLIKLFFY